MPWSVELLNETVEGEIGSLPADMQARYLRIAELLIEHGPQNVGMPHVRPLGDNLWEMRIRGRDGIARAIYFAATRRRLIVLRVFTKKGKKTPKSEIRLAKQRRDMLS